MPIILCLAANSYNFAAQIKYGMQLNHILFSALAAAYFSLGIQAQEMNRSINDQVRNRPVLVDYVDRAGLQTGEFADFFTAEYDAYQPDIEIVGKLGNSLHEDIQIMIVLATWCSDSKREVPRFLKLLDLIGFDDSNLVMVGVDSHKKAYDVSVDELNIEFVPTFIILRKEVELGRIIEYPENSLEADLLRIIN
jgi:thiol-disulfide isomerase/thioredoxin